MLKSLAAMSLVALLSLSPALAADDPAPAKCATADQWLEEIPIKPFARLTGDAAKSFVAEANAYATTQGADKLIPPLDYNEVILWPKQDGSAVFVMFVANCSRGYGHLTLDALNALAGPKSKDDGSL